VSNKLGKDIINLNNIKNFQHWTPVSLRFSDQDSLGHINNVSYAAYIEQARVAFINKIVSPQSDHINYILANLQIDYRREMHFPGNVDVGACLLKIGNKSITTGYGLFKDTENIATGSSVNVFFDSNTRETIAIPDNLRKSLENKLVGS